MFDRASGEYFWIADNPKQLYGISCLKVNGVEYDTYKCYYDENPDESAFVRNALEKIAYPVLLRAGNGVCHEIACSEEDFEDAIAYYNFQKERAERLLQHVLDRVQEVEGLVCRAKNTGYQIFKEEEYATD